jgi:WD40 repeat protein
MKPHLLLLLVAALAFTSLAWAQGPAELKGHTALVSSVAFNKAGNLLASGSYDKSVKLWDYPSGKVLQTLNHGAAVYTVAFNVDGNVVASGAQDNIIKLWNPQDGKSIQELKGHTGIVTSIAYSPDGVLLASGSADKSVRLWETKGQAKELKNLGSHKESVYSVAFSPNGEYLASGSFDGAVKVWDVKGQKEIKQFLAEPLKLAFLEEKKEDKKEPKKEEKKDEKKKVEAKKDDKKQAKKEEPKEIRDNVTGVAFTPDNKYVLSVGFDKMLRVWDIADGKEIKALGPIPHWTNGLSVSRDGKNVAVAGYGGSLHAWEIGSWKDLGGTQLEKAIVYAVTFTPDGKALVTGHERPDDVIKVTPLSALTLAPPKKK